MRRGAEHAHHQAAAIAQVRHGARTPACSHVEALAACQGNMIAAEASYHNTHASFHPAATLSQAQLQAQVQQAAAAQHVGGVVQGTPQDVGQQQPGGEQTPGYTYRNRARRKACEKPTVRLCFVTS